MKTMMSCTLLDLLWHDLLRDVRTATLSCILRSHLSTAYSRLVKSDLIATTAFRSPRTGMGCSP